MFRKTFTALLTVASLSFAGAAFAAAPTGSDAAATAEAKPTKATKPAKMAKVKKGAKHTASVPKAAAPTTTTPASGAQQVDMGKQKAQPRVAKKTQRMNKKAHRVALRTGSTKAVSK